MLRVAGGAVEGYEAVEFGFGATGLGVDVGPVAAAGADAVGVVGEAVAGDGEVGDGLGREEEGGVGGGGFGGGADGFGGGTGGSDTTGCGGLVGGAGGGRVLRWLGGKCLGEEQGGKEDGGSLAEVVRRQDFST